MRAGCSEGLDARSAERAISYRRAPMSRHTDIMVEAFEMGMLQKSAHVRILPPKVRSNHDWAADMVCAGDRPDLVAGGWYCPGWHVPYHDESRQKSQLYTSQ